MPSRTILLPCIPGSSNDFRSGERGLKKGPAVCAGVMSSVSAQAGVGAIPTVAATASRPRAVRLNKTSDTIRDAARNPRRVRLKSFAIFIGLTLHGIAAEARSFAAGDSSGSTPVAVTGLGVSSRSLPVPDKQDVDTSGDDQRGVVCRRLRLKIQNQKCRPLATRPGRYSG